MGKPTWRSEPGAGRHSSDKLLECLMRSACWPSVLCLTLFLAGCSGRDPDLPDCVPVTGTVKLDDKPAANATLQFVPIGSTIGTGSGGATDAGGKYQLRTAHSGSGAPVGEYKV